MCVLAFSWRQDAEWPLVLAGNRDERHDRPSAPLQRWAEDQRVLAGRDLVAGGGWLGVSERGLLTTVTNVRSDSPYDPARPSRGWLIRDLLLGSGDYAQPTAQQLTAFNPLNLLTFSPDEATFISNRPAAERRVLAPGAFALANEGFDEAVPRADQLKSGLQAWLGEGGAAVDDLFDLLADGRKTPLTAPPYDRRIFMRMETYGTRCSTVVRVAADGRGEIVERSYDASAEIVGERGLSFRWRPFH